jgi:hypothetical protein
MRKFKTDARFSGGNVLKTPFKRDVARVYLRKDNLIVIQFGREFFPLAVPDDASLPAILSLASATLDKWETNNFQEYINKNS